MSFAARLVHTATLVHTPYDEDTPDDYGQPTAGTPVETTLAVNIQPKAGTEMADSRSAGSEVADYRIYLPLTPAIETGDYFVWNGDRYDVLHVQPYQMGRSPHQEIDAKRIAAAAVPVGAGS